MATTFRQLLRFFITAFGAGCCGAGFFLILEVVFFTGLDLAFVT
jgi:hypothetical protein